MNTALQHAQHAQLTQLASPCGRAPISLQDLHRDAWRQQHRDESVPGGRDFLFDFDLTAPPKGDRVTAAIFTRSVLDAAPLRQNGLYEMSCRFAPLRRHGKEERPVPAAEFEAWLRDLLNRNGMALLRLDRAESLSARMGKGNALLRTVKATFVARVVDLTAAAQAYRSGIGRHKAWGCGMLCVRQSQ